MIVICGFMEETRVRVSDYLPEWSLLGTDPLALFLADVDVADAVSEDADERETVFRVDAAVGFFIVAIFRFNSSDEDFFLGSCPCTGTATCVICVRRYTVL